MLNHPSPWTEKDHIDMMESLNISKSILSITSPGTHLVAGDDELARTVTRDCNLFAADMKKRDPRFGFWASLPLPDIQGSLTEIAFALDELSADGVAVETNAHGKYLGHHDFDPVFDELNRRHAIVFIHPTTPCMASSGHKAVPLPDFPRPMFEFFFDTARAVMNLFMSGTIHRCPNVTFIIPHCGGAFPPLIRRFSSAAPLMGLNLDISPSTVKASLNKQFYFDTAGWAFPEQITGLLEWVDFDRILYGSDFPYTRIKMVTGLSEDHDTYLPTVFEKEEERKALCTQNALKLLKRSH